MIPTVGQNEIEMRDLAIELMQANYKAADNCAKEYAKSGDVQMRNAAKGHLQLAEVWRVRARQHGANV